MDELTPEQRAFAEAARTFAEDEVAPSSAAAGEIPLDLVRRMGELGLFGIPFPSTYGGLDGGLTTFCVCLEELGRVDVSVARLLATAVCGASSAIFRLGTDAQRLRWLPSLARGVSVGGFAILEPEHLEAGATSVRATPGADGWVLEGTVEVRNASTPLTRTCVIVARNPDGSGVSAFVVDADDPGMTVGSPEGSVWGGRSTVALEACRLSADRLLGGHGRGDALLDVVAEGQISDAAVAAGTVEDPEDARRLRAAYRAAARLRDQGRPFRAEAAAALGLAGVVAHP